MQFHGVEIPVNLMSVSFSEKFETALAGMNEQLGRITGDSLPQALKAQIDCVHTFIGRVFGDEMYARLALDADDLAVHLDLMEKIVDETAAQKQKMLQRFQKYSPDRLQRREK